MGTAELSDDRVPKVVEGLQIDLVPRRQGQRVEVQHRFAIDRAAGGAARGQVIEQLRDGSLGFVLHPNGRLGVGGQDFSSIGFDVVLTGLISVDEPHWRGSEPLRNLFKQRPEQLVAAGRAKERPVGDQHCVVGASRQPLDDLRYVDTKLGAAVRPTQARARHTERVDQRHFRRGLEDRGQLHRPQVVEVGVVDEVLRNRHRRPDDRYLHLGSTSFPAHLMRT